MAAKDVADLCRTRLLSGLAEGVLVATAGAGQLDRGRFEVLQGPEGDLAVFGVHDYRVAGAVLLPEDPLRERVLDHALQGPAQGPGAMVAS